MAEHVRSEEQQENNKNFLGSVVLADKQNN